MPRSTVIDQRRTLIFDPDHIARVGVRELPPVGPELGNLIGVARPIIDRISGDQIAFAQIGISGRDGHSRTGSASLNKHIQKGQRLIMGDMFLSLRGLDIGHGQAG